MALVSNEVKMAIAYMRSIDKSLGRIAYALEKQNGISNEEDNIVWRPGHTIVPTKGEDDDLK